MSAKKQELPAVDACIQTAGSSCFFIVREHVNEQELPEAVLRMSTHSFCIVREHVNEHSLSPDRQQLT